MAPEFEDFDAALAQACRDIGGGNYKAVAVLLWPDIAPDTAARKLADCFNAQRPERLKPRQVYFILRLARQHGRHEAVQWLLRSLDYAPTSPQKPRDEQAELQRAFVVAKDELAAILARMEALQGAGGAAA